MKDFSYNNLFLKSFSSFLVSIRKCFFSIIILSLLTPLLKFSLYRVLGDFLGGWYIIFLDIIFKPLLLISLFTVLNEFQSLMNGSFYQELFVRVRSKYLKLALLYLLVTCFAIYLGSGAVILHSVIFLKIPFIEVMIFSSNIGLLEGVKQNNSITQDKLLRYLLMMLFAFLLIRLLVIRGVSSTNIAFSGEILTVAMEFIRNLLLMIYFSYIFSLYKTLKEENMYLK